MASCTFIVIIPTSSVGIGMAEFGRVISKNCYGCKCERLVVYTPTASEIRAFIVHQGASIFCCGQTCFVTQRLVSCHDSTCSNNQPTQYNYNGYP